MLTSQASPGWDGVCTMVVMVGRVCGGGVGERSPVFPADYHSQFIYSLGSAYWFLSSVPLLLNVSKKKKNKKKQSIPSNSHTLGRAKPFLAVFPALGPITAIVPERLCQGAEWCDRKSINLCCVNSQLCHVQLYDLGQVIYFLCFTETLPKVTFGIPDSKTLQSSTGW